MNALFVIFVCIFSVCWGSRTGATEADQWLGSDRQKTFESFVKILQEMHPPSVRGLERMGTTWEKELRRTEERFHSAKTREDVYYAMLSLKNSMHDYHSQPLLATKLEPKTFLVKLPFVARPQQADGKVKYIVHESFTKQLPEGAQILSIGGQNVESIEQDLMEWTNTSSPELHTLLVAKWLSYRRSNDLPAPRPGELTHVSYKISQGAEIQTAKLHWRESPNLPDPKGCSVAGSASDYGKYKPEVVGVNFCIYMIEEFLVIRYFSFYYDFSDEFDSLWNRLVDLTYKPSRINPVNSAPRQLAEQDLQAILAFLQKVRPKKIIIDVRDNTGGNIFPKFIAMFAHKPFRLLTRKLIFSRPIKESESFFAESLKLGDPEMVPLVRKDLADGKSESRSFPFFCKSKTCDISEASYKPLNLGWKFTTYVLSGPLCLSSCDQFVSIMKDNKIAEIVGLPPAGAHSPFRAFLPLTLANGEIIKVQMTLGEGYRVSGEPLEGNPAQPDRRIEFRKDYLNSVIEDLESLRKDS